MDTRAQALLDFWFHPPDSPDYGQYRDIWFASHSGPEFDRECRDRFLADHQAAAARRLDAWIEAPLSCLALIVLCDQLPRNMFRGEPDSFATDPIARAAARKAVDAGWDKAMFDVQRLFVYMPFEHSENLEDQRRCVALFEAMPDSDHKQGWIDPAVQHLEIIERFGRFPHRNEILGRESTPEEVHFLAETGLRFGAQKREATG
jgi:uncharacterized protein (DUF924 family)